MFNITRLFLTNLVIFCVTLPMYEADAATFGGIEFPDGFSSFADEVISYDCAYNNGAGAGTCPTGSTRLDPTRSLGAPGGGHVSLGLGGLLELAFTDNLLTNSGDSSVDLWIFETGAPQGGETERTFVAVRPTAATLALSGFSGTMGANGFFEVGSAGGSTDGIDIDLFFRSFAPGVLQFDAIQLVDRDYNPALGGSHGADIDAVGAISSVAPIPIPPASLLLGTGVILIAAFRKRESKRYIEGNRGSQEHP